MSVRNEYAGATKVAEEPVKFSELDKQIAARQPCLVSEFTVDKALADLDKLSELAGDASVRVETRRDGRFGVGEEH